MRVMPKKEILNQSLTHERMSPVEPRVKKHIVIGTWAMSKKEPHLYFWRDLNSYDNDPYTIGILDSTGNLDKAARGSVADSFAYYGIDRKKAEGGIKRVKISGTTTYTFLKEAKGGNPDEWKWGIQRVPMVFVEVMPSLIKQLTKRGGGLAVFYPARTLKPNSRANNTMERRVGRAFKKFAANKDVKTK